MKWIQSAPFSPVGFQLTDRW